MKFIPKKKLVEAVTSIEPKVAEAVAKDKGYDYEAVANVIVTELKATNEDYDYIFDTVSQTSIDPDDMTPSEVDNAIKEISSHYDLPQNIIEQIENKISALKSPSEVKQEEEVNSLQDDYDTLKDLIGDGKFESSYTHDFLYDTMQKIEAKMNELRSSHNSQEIN